LEQHAEMGGQLVNHFVLLTLVYVPVRDRIRLNARHVRETVWSSDTALTWIPVAEFVDRIEAQSGRLVLERINDVR
jgi:hypothetical protein